MLADFAAISAGENEIHGSRTVESLCTTTGRRMAMGTGILRTPSYQLFRRNSTTYSDSGGDLGLQTCKISDAYFQYLITPRTCVTRIKIHTYITRQPLQSSPRSTQIPSSSLPSASLPPSFKPAPPPTAARESDNRPGGMRGPGSNSRSLGVVVSELDE